MQRAVCPLLREAQTRDAEAMVAPTLSYIESDFTDALETCDEYRKRTARPRKSRMRRLLALS